MRHPARLACLAAALFAALPASALAQEKKLPDCKISLEPMPITFAAARMLPSVPAFINGNPTMAVIDLSSPDTYLNIKVLDRMGIPSSPLNSTARGVGGSRSEYSAKVHDIAVGSAKGKGTFLAYDDGDLEYGVHLGTNYLLKKDVELSFAEKTLRFVSSQDCEKANLAYWEGVSTWIPFDSYSDRDLRPAFTITVDGKKLKALLSTSIENSVIDVDAASRLPGKATAFTGQGTSRARGLGKTTMPVWVGDFNQIDIGGEKISNAKLNVMSLSGISADVILGMDYIRSHRILISMSQRRIYFTYTGGQLFNTGGDNVEWITSEANGGNSFAMFRLAAKSESSTGSEDISADALAWYRKAAAAGHYGAKLRMASHEFRLGNFGASAAAFQDAFRLSPPSATPVAMWYTAAARSGDRAAALEELKALRSKLSNSDAWGTHILDFHLGKITAEKLLQHAVEDEKQSALRLCEANFELGQDALIAGRSDAARAAFGKARDACPPRERERYLSVIELGRLDSAAK